MTNARVAGSAFLLYIGLGLPGGTLIQKATTGEGVAAKLASVAQHASDVRAAIVLILFSSFCALVIGVTLYSITREVDSDLAMLAMAFRVGEGVIGGVTVQRSLGLLRLATGADSNAPDSLISNALGALFLSDGGLGLIGALFFAMGSAIFSWLLLRGRMIPPVLAWLGVVASILWIIGLPLQLVGILRGTVIWLYIPMAAFEIPFALWLLIKGVTASTTITRQLEAVR